MYPRNSQILDRYLYLIGTQDPRSRSFLKAQLIDVTQKFEKNDLYSQLIVANQQRLDAYSYFWDLYFGAHWYNVSDEKLNPIKANYIHAIVNKHVSFLMNKGFRASSQFPEIEEYLNEMWDLNEATKSSNHFGTQLAIQGGVTGDTIFDMKIKTNKDLNIEYLSMEVLPTTQFFPVLSEGKVEGILIYGDWQKVVKENYGFSSYDTTFKGEYYKADGTIYHLRDEKVISEETSAIKRMPIVHIRNFATPQNFYGMSDLINVYDLNKSIDSILTDIQAVIDYQSQPVTILKGAKIGDLSRGPNRIWTLPKDAEINNLELQGELTASSEQVKRLKEIIAEVSNVPEGSLGKMQPISNTSAVALAIMFMPLYETMEFKRTTYGIGLLEAQTYAIQVAALRGWIDVNSIIESALKRWDETFKDAEESVKAFNYPFSKKVNENKDYNSLSAFYSGEIPKEIFQSSIIWFPPLPRDEAVETDKILARVNGKFWSKKYGRQQEGLSEYDNILIEKQLLKEAEVDARLEQKTAVTNEQVKTKIKSGLEGTGEVKGTNEMARVQKNVNKI